MPENIGQQSEIDNQKESKVSKLSPDLQVLRAISIKHEKEVDEWREKAAKKRFLWPEDKIVRKRLHELKNLFTEFNNKHPQIVGLTLYGSYVRTRANSESDIDGTIYIEAHESKPLERDFEILLSSDFEKKLWSYSYYLHKLNEEIKTEIRNRLSLDSEKLDHLRFFPINVELIKSAIDCLKNEYNNSATNYLSKLFSLSIGKGLDKYRNQFLLELKKVPSEIADKIWISIVNLLIYYESGHDFINKKSGTGKDKDGNIVLLPPINPPDKRGYPRNFQEAYEKYGGKNNQ